MAKSISERIREDLFLLQDLEYKEFQAKLMPTIEKDTIIGVRTPGARNLAKQYQKDPELDLFLHDLPHKYYDENNIHGFLLCGLKDFQKCVEEVERFLPYVDNWATCDMMHPKIFAKHKQDLLPYIKKWIQTEDTYTIRYAIGMLMSHFLDEDFDLSYATMVSKVVSEEYYINMMSAWYFATALAKQWEAIIPFLENNTLDIWVHNKTIQKAVESFRITNEQKEYLRSLKRKNA